MPQLSYDTQRADRLAIGLGWFSIGLGLAEVAATGPLMRLIGVRDGDRTRTILRACGAREIANGVAILSDPERASWLWARVAGDGADLSLLGSALQADNADRGRTAIAAAAVAGVTVLDMVAARRLSENGEPHVGVEGTRAVRVEQAITVNRSVDEVYRFWRNLENLPRFMRHLESVKSLGGNRSRWRAKAPAGMTVEWDAEIVEDRASERIAWRSIPRSDVENEGSVRFEMAPGARGTEVHVRLLYTPPGGAIGRGVAWLFGEEPKQQIREDLRRFKQILETGEITLSDGPGLWRAAQPRRVKEIRTLAGVNE
jgi:uncharacterized membrane protein